MIKAKPIRHYKHLILSASVALFVALPSISTQLIAQTNAVSPATGGVPVEVVPVETKTIQAIVYGQGTARAVRREFLSFDAEGKITFIRKGADGRDLAAGDSVQGPEHGEQNGELLASVDSRDSLKRMKDLLATNVISRSDFEKSVASAKQARAVVKAKKAGIESATLAVTASLAQQVQAQIALERTSI